MKKKDLKTIKQKQRYFWLSNFHPITGIKEPRHSPTQIGIESKYLNYIEY